MSTAVIDRGREMLNGAKPEGAVTDQLDLVVHPFERAIGDPQLSPGQNPVEMSPQPSNQVPERLESGAHGRVHPALQMLFGPSGLTVAPKELKGFLQVIGADDGRVPAHQGGKTLPFVGPQVPRVLEQQKAGALKRGLLQPAQTVHLTTPDFIEGPVQMLHQMKAVEENLSVGSVVADGLEISLPHIQADHSDGGRATSPELGEEAGQGLLGSILAHPKQDAAFQVIDHGEIMMPLAATHLIDP